MNYSVGQILYVVFKKDNKVVPVQVTEEITRKTLDGLRVDYTVKAGSSNDTTVSLDLLMKEGEIFNTPEQAVETLSSRARNSITKIVKVAVDKAHQWYGPPRRLESVELEDGETVHEVIQKQEKVRVVLPDGTVAHASLPANIPSTPQVG